MTPDQWTPPERIWVEPPLPGRSVLLADAAPDEDLDDEVEYVLASALDALREENARLKAKGLDDFTVTGDEYDRLLDERDALRARVEELEAGLRSALASCEEAAAGQCDCDGYYRCNDCPGRIARDAEDAAEILRALLSGGQEPRPDTSNISTSPGGIASERQVEPDGLPNRSSYGPDAPPGEASRSLYSSSQEPRPDTDETCPTCDGRRGVVVNRLSGGFWESLCTTSKGTGRRPENQPKETT